MVPASGRTRNSWVSMVRKISQYRSAQPPSIDFSTSAYIEGILEEEREERKKKNGEKRGEKRGGRDFEETRRRYIDFNGRRIVHGFIEDKYDNNCLQRLRKNCVKVGSKNKI